MASVGKVVGFFGGFVIGSWEGAFAGLILGGVVDSYMSKPDGQKSRASFSYSTYSSPFTSIPVQDFNTNLIALTAIVMQSDGKTTRSELDYVRSFFIRQFGVEKTQENLLILRDMLKRNIPMDMICIAVRQNMAYQGRIQLLHYLFGIAHADHSFSPQEESTLNRMAQLLGINMTDYASVAAMFSPANNNAAYETLGISSSANEDEIKKAYRQMALKFHPDKVNHLGEDVRKSAEEKFKNIQAAYEDIKKARGLV